MVKPIITPWRSHANLLQVRTQIYSSDPEIQRHAVARIMAWKLRGSLPHTVESTALLVDAILHHAASATSSSNSIFSIRAVYSAAFTRFVTGLCDIGRNKERSLEPSSMQEIARHIGMPPEFVALRHEATHEELPAIQRLVKATEEGLRWLWEFYWSKLEDVEGLGSGARVLGEVKARAKEILRTYRSTRREMLKGKKVRDGTEETSAARKDLLRLMESSQARRKAVADVLVEEKLLVPAKRALGSSLDGAYLIWDSLLRDVIVVSTSFLMALQQSMIEALMQRDGENVEQDADSEALCHWIVHMKDYSVSPAQQKAYTRHALSTSCLHSGHWLQWLGERILDSSSAEDREDWSDLVEASRIGQGEIQGPGDAMMQDDSVATDMSETIGDASAETHVRACRWKRAAMPVGLPIGVV